MLFRLAGSRDLCACRGKLGRLSCNSPNSLTIQPISRGAHQESKRWPRLDWFYIPASVGFGVVAFIQLKHMWKRNKVEYSDVDGNSSLVLNQWQVDLFKKFPTRALSRGWGALCTLQIPQFLRKPMFNSYSYLFDCNLDEASVSDVGQFQTFNEFFKRRLKPDARVIDQTATLISPADATVMTFGCMPYSNLHIDQVKGLSYPLDVFLGPRHPFMRGLHASFAPTLNANMYAPGNCRPLGGESGGEFKIFYLSVYLSPGDYHWFHSPTDWTVEHRRHIPGDLFSVNPRVLRSINGIFNFNERVILSGHWEHGLFMYAAIGAYNVGSIVLESKFERDLKTNKRDIDTSFKDRLYGAGELHRRGDSLGGFELGSSLVLVFTAPKDFKFDLNPGQKLKYGEPIGYVTTGTD